MKPVTPLWVMLDIIGYVRHYRLCLHYGLCLTIALPTHPMSVQNEEVNDGQDDEQEWRPPDRLECCYTEGQQQSQDCPCDLTRSDCDRGLWLPTLGPTSIGGSQLGEADSPCADRKTDQQTTHDTPVGVTRDEA